MTEVGSVGRRILARLDCEPSAIAGAAPPDLDVTWTNADVRAQADQFSAAFLAAGVAPTARVGLQMSPSMSFISAVLASWQIGASFVPISPTASHKAKQFVLDTSACSICVTEPPPRLPKTGGSVEIEVSTTSRGAYAGGSTQFADEAYVIFTSGSSGDPKGVSVSHAALASYLDGAGAVYVPAADQALFPFQLPPYFDAAITSYLLPLIFGGVCVPLGGPVPSQGLAELLRRSGGRRFVLKTTPTQLSLLRRLLSPQTVSRLTGDLVIGGEALHFENCSWLAGGADLVLHNEYGPTEATVGCIVHSFRPSGSSRGAVPLGQPLTGVQIQLEPYGDGGPLFELVVAGACLANGYLDGIAGGFGRSGHGRVYRTGDLVRRDDRHIYHAGRLDNLMKVGGRRVEPGEIENVLRQHPAIRDAVVFLDQGRVVAAVSGTTVDLRELRAFLTAALDRDIIPRKILVLEDLPVAGGGKVDMLELRRRLHASHS